MKHKIFFQKVLSKRSSINSTCHIGQEKLRTLFFTMLWLCMGSRDGDSHILNFRATVSFKIHLFYILEKKSGSVWA